MIEIKKEEIPIEEAINSLRNPRRGAIVSYLGTVRDFAEGKHTSGMIIEADETTMRKGLEGIEEEARQKFAVEEIAIVHRIGTLAVGESVLLIIVGAVHREPAFEACKFIIDQIKSLHTLWKREIV